MQHTHDTSRRRATDITHVISHRISPRRQTVWRNALWPECMRPRAGGPRRATHIMRGGQALVAISGLLVGLAACAPSTVGGPSTIPTVTVVPHVVQHTTQLMLAPKEVVQGTATCGPNEVLLSGGFDTTAFTPPGNDQGIYFVDSYPSDAAGTPPAGQGQIETSWTVRVYTANSLYGTLPPQASVPVTVNCLQGTTAQSGVWRHAFALQPTGPDSAMVACTDPVFGTLTGGGFQLNDSVASGTMMASYPTAPNGLHHKAWMVQIRHVPTINPPPHGGTAYAVCLTQLYDQPLTQQQLMTPASAVGWELQQVSVGCPDPSELLVGGGYQLSDPLWVGESELVAPQLSAWRVAAWVGTTTPPQLPITAWAICIGTTPAPQPTATSSGPVPTPTATPQLGVCKASDFPTKTPGGPSEGFAYLPHTYYYDLGQGAGNHYYVLCSPGTPATISAFLVQALPAGGWTVTQSSSTKIAARKPTTPASGYCYSVDMTFGSHAGYPGEWDADFHPPILSC
jgi:hypothetical protein